jgi:RNA polymerase II subunit A small phosphatase-like protein
MGEKQQHTGTPESGSPRTLTNPPKKKGGFLSFLCCGAKPSDDDESFAAKPVKTKPDRTDVAAKPEASTADSSTAGSGEPLNEKTADGVHAGQTGDASADKSLPAIAVGRRPSNRDKPQPPLPGAPGRLDTTAASGPSIAVEAPTPISAADEQMIHDRTPKQEAIDTDIEMTDAGATVPIAANEVSQTGDEPTGAQPLHKDASQVKIDLPPPPPLAERQAQVTPPKSPEATAGQAEPQKWLLPPARPEHRDRKCLILDLDETLVHSSFKVRTSYFITGSDANSISDSASSGLYNSR